jgi:hypothetical protein
MPPKPSIQCDIWQPTVMNWLPEHLKVEDAPALAD